MSRELCQYVCTTEVDLVRKVVKNGIAGIMAKSGYYCGVNTVDRKLLSTLENYFVIPVLYHFFENPPFSHRIRENRVDAMFMQPFGSDKRVKTRMEGNERNWDMVQVKRRKISERGKDVRVGVKMIGKRKPDR